MLRKICVGVTGAALALSLTACGGGSEKHTASSTDTSSRQSASPGTGSVITSKPKGLPEDSPIPENDGNNCKGQGMEADIYIGLNAPFKHGRPETHLLKDNGAVMNTALYMSVADGVIEWQVTKAGSYICDAFVKYGDTWRRVESRPLMQLTLQGSNITAVYVTAYDINLESIGGDAAS